jgi:hypothetical protein
MIANFMQTSAKRLTTEPISAIIKKLQTFQRQQAAQKGCKYACRGKMNVFNHGLFPSWKRPVLFLVLDCCGSLAICGGCGVSREPQGRHNKVR